jgi:hypothetical protein
LGSAATGGVGSGAGAVNLAGSNSSTFVLSGTIPFRAMVVTRSSSALKVAVSHHAAF